MSCGSVGKDIVVSPDWLSLLDFSSLSFLMLVNMPEICKAIDIFTIFLEYEIVGGTQ